MGLLDRLLGPNLQEQMEQQDVMLDVLTEDITRLQLALEDQGWTRLAATHPEQFSRDDLTRVVSLCRIMRLKNPLIKRAVNLRTFYVWAQGVEVRARDEDVNELVQEIITDRGNREAFFGHRTRTALERSLHTDGQIFPVLVGRRDGFTSVRTIPFDEMVDRRTDPDDRTDGLAILRRYRKEGRTVSQWHPTIDWTPRPRNRPNMIDGHPVVWDQPVLHVTAAGGAYDRWATPDVYAAIDWARAYKDFLEDWASYVKALARFAWRHKTKGSNAAAVKATHETSRDRGDGTRVPAGSTAVTGLADDLQPVKQSGAHVDSDSGRPLAQMVSAATDVPVGMLLGTVDDANRAAQTSLDRPFELALVDRRGVWTDTYQRMLDWAVDHAVLSNRLPGKVTLGRDASRRVVMPDKVDRTIDVDWPALEEHDLKDVTEAYKNASETGVFTTPETAGQLLRGLLQVFGVEDVDQLVQDAIDAAEQAPDEQTAEERVVDQVEEALAAAVEEMSANGHVPVSA